MQLLAVQIKDPVRLCWSRCIAVHPMHLQHLCSTFIGVLAEAAGIERECVVFEQLRRVWTARDLGHIDWGPLSARLLELAPYPCPRLEEAISHVRLFATLALVHHQVWLAKSGSTLKLLGRCRLPQDLPPELSFLHREFEQLLAEADGALQAGRANLTHFQRQALSCHPLPALLWAILRQTRPCYEVYRQAIKAAHDIARYAAWYLAWAEVKGPGTAQRAERTDQPVAAGVTAAAVHTGVHSGLTTALHRHARRRKVAFARPAKGNSIAPSSSTQGKQVSSAAAPTHVHSAKRGGSIIMSGAPTGSELLAFCNTCPPAYDVTNALAVLGYTLTFQMGEQVFSASTQTAPIPAQYHYRNDEHGTEVIYLEGKDVGDGQERLPAHASRFWIYPGTSEQAAQLVAQVLGTSWRLSWRQSCSPPERAAIA